MEYRAIDICEQIASEKVLELAIKYAGRIHRMALANKIETIADKKEEESRSNVPDAEEFGFTNHNDRVEAVDSQEDIMLTPTIKPKSDIVIKPMSFSAKRSNPFRRAGPSPTSRGNFSMSNAFLKLF